MSASLFPYINQDRCYGSNIASTSTSGELTRLILRAHDTRHETDDDQSLTCIDDDSGMLVTVAFSELVRIRQILVTAATADERIDNVKVWANRVDPPSLDEAEDGSMKPDQEFRLLDGERACVEYPVRVARFSSVSTITLYLHSFRPSPQRVFYLGFMGEAITYRKEVGESISIGAQNTADSVVHGMKEKYGSASSTIR